MGGSGDRGVTGAFDLANRGACLSLRGVRLSSPAARQEASNLAKAVMLLVVVAAWWFYPVWTAEVIPYTQWTWRMWMPTWV